MALDHYVPQVHLKNFNSPELNNAQVYGIQKSKLKVFPCHSRSICRIEDGNSTSYLAEPRIIEEFLKIIEPNYNRCLDELRNEHISHEVILVFSAFISFLLACTPTAIRLSSYHHRKLVEVESKLLDKSGEMPPPPPILGGASLTELLEKGKISIEVDSEYSLARNISVSMDTTKQFGNFPWEILINENPDCPFVTSDHPIGLQTRTYDTRVINRIVPLAPDVAIRVLPDINTPDPPSDLSFPNFRYAYKKVTSAEAEKVNTLLIRCADDLVLFRDNHPWIHALVERNRDYWIEPVFHELPSDGGTYQIMSSKVAKRNMYE